MFARAAIIGRVSRERAEARRNFLATKEEIKKQTPVAPFRRRCFIPLMKAPCLVLALAMCLITCGAVMCNFAFHAEKLSSTTHHDSYNTTKVVINDLQFKLLRSFTYIGPALMGFGIFIIIIACVVLLDKRDKILKDYILSMIATQQEISKELSYRATMPCKPIERIASKQASSLANEEHKLDAESQLDVMTSLLPADQQTFESNKYCDAEQTSESEKSIGSKRTVDEVAEGR